MASSANSVPASNGSSSSKAQNLAAQALKGYHDLNGRKNVHDCAAANGVPPNVTTQDNVNSPIEVPVLIVGAGPTGLLMGYMLSQLGVQSLVIEKYPIRLAAPKAHAINPRTFEICRQFNLDTKSIRSLGSPRTDAFWVNFVTSLSGDRIGRLPYERMDAPVLDATPEMIHNIPQPVFEQFVEAHTTWDSNVNVRRGLGFVSCVQDGGRVTTTVEERKTSKKYEIRSQYAVACDGARSTVRNFLGIECDGEDSYEAMMTIHINADLRPILGSSGLGMLHWILDPAVSGFIIGYDLSDNQVLICNFDAKKHPVSSWTTEHARSVVSAALGRDDVKFDVLSYRPWILSRKVAQQYSNAEGNIFLCGDAAHAFPPTGGLGLNCGLADVHNLAYKLAANIQGWGSQDLLKSYERERRPIAELYARQSVKNGKKIFGFLKALGIADTTDTDTDDLDEVRRKLVKRVKEPEMQSIIAEGIEGQREHFDNLELHLGYVYDDASYLPPHASHFEAKFVPGARLPHVWIKPRPHILPSNYKPVDLSYVSDVSASSICARQFSSLDLVPNNGFALMVSAKRDWRDRLEHVRRRLAVRGVKVSIYITGEDFEFTVAKDGATWAENLGLSSGGGVVVRPDQHILTRFGPDSFSDGITNAILQHLGL